MKREEETKDSPAAPEARKGEGKSIGERYPPSTLLPGDVITFSQPPFKFLRRRRKSRRGESE